MEGGGMRRRGMDGVFLGWGRVVWRAVGMGVRP